MRNRPAQQRHRRRAYRRPSLNVPSGIRGQWWSNSKPRVCYLQEGHHTARFVGRTLTAARLKHWAERLPAIEASSHDRTDARAPEQHLAGYCGILQADAYAGFNTLYAPDRRRAPITEAACVLCRGSRMPSDARSLKRHSHHVQLRTQPTSYTNHRARRRAAAHSAYLQERAPQARPSELAQYLARDIEQPSLPRSCLMARPTAWFGRRSNSGSPATWWR
jgi:hypothetical protein